MRGGILSERIRAIRSLGPVPALLLMTTDIPRARMMQPATMLTIRTARGEPLLIRSRRSQVKKSMIGPPQKAQTTVPGLT